MIRINLILAAIFTLANLAFVPGATANSYLSNSTLENSGKVSKQQKQSKFIFHVKFQDSSQIVLRGGKFVSQSGADTTEINNYFNSTKVSKKSRLFSDSYDNIKQKRQDILSKKKVVVADLNSYFRGYLKSDQDIELFVQGAKELPLVTEVYAEPLPAQAPVSPDYSSLQTHFKAAPNGVGVNPASSLPGALGDNVRIADIEYGWNTAHEDLSDARQSDTLIANGTPADPFNDPNHGTAAIGLISGDRNSIGVNGISPNAKLHLINSYNVERGWDIANAIYTAQSRLTAGDVMLIEQQTWGPDGHGFVPVEWVPVVYDSIKFATASGIIVVEAAGNGSENLDDSIYGTSFPEGKSDSGAIIVGAGSACDGSSNHSRLSFSNYGKRVNVQGYGECVTTSGYGSLNYSEVNSNAWYTNSFNGTSSASAMVAGAAASVSSAYEQQHGSSPSSTQLRSLLIQTGTTQNMSSPGSIGPLPNIDAAIRSFLAVDTIPPSKPSNLSATLNSLNKVVLRWTASIDNKGPVTYQIYRNNKLFATTSSANFTDTSVRRNTSYTYKVRAIDGSNNYSSFSNSVTIKTRK